MGSVGSYSKPKEFPYWDYDETDELNNTIDWFNANSNMQSWMANLSDEERNVLVNYAVYDYIPINELLRYGRLPITYHDSSVEDVSNSIKNIRAAIDNFTLNKPIIVTRTANATMLGLDAYAGYNKLSKLIGQEVTPKGFVSTNAGGSTTIADNLDFVIKVPSGKGIGAYLGNGIGNTGKGESEFLIKDGFRYKVTNVQRQGYGNTVVYLELLK